MCVVCPVSASAYVWLPIRLVSLFALLLFSPCCAVAPARSTFACLLPSPQALQGPGLALAVPSPFMA
jgi:hypothetical protein